MPIPARPNLQKVFMLTDIVHSPFSQSFNNKVNGGFPGVPAIREEVFSDSKKLNPADPKTLTLEVGKTSLQANSKASQPTASTS